MHEGPTQEARGQSSGSAANMQYGMHVGLGQLAEPPTRTTERVEKALATLLSIE